MFLKLCGFANSILLFFIVNTAFAFDPCFQVPDVQNLSVTKNRELLNRIMHHCPKNSMTLLQLGHFMERENQLDDAEKIYNQILYTADLAYQLKAQSGLVTISRKRNNIRAARAAYDAMGELLEKAKKTFFDKEILTEMENFYAIVGQDMQDLLKKENSEKYMMQPLISPVPHIANPSHVAPGIVLKETNLPLIGSDKSVK
ncbi:MAG: hypothetical protein H7832_00705 [Magnetococcus sp. DMHC-6]